MVCRGLFSDFWEILGLGLYGTLCSGNRLNKDNFVISVNLQSCMGG